MILLGYILKGFSYNLAEVGTQVELVLEFTLVFFTARVWVDEYHFVIHLSLRHKCVDSNFCYAVLVKAIADIHDRFINFSIFERA